MATSKSSGSKSSSAKAAPKKEPKFVDDETAVARRVEVRVDDQIVYSQALYNAKIEGDANGLKVDGTTDRPQIEVTDEDHVYDPTTDELPGPNVATPQTPTSVPVPDPRDTEEIIEQFHDGSRE